MPMSPEYTDEELIVVALQDIADELTQIRTVLEKAFSVPERPDRP